ncbi:putative long flagella protein lf4 [Tritrichomonas foetus]|uniref:Long flagella protein lf4 n=1 Tax=Tritrichomonas foetus TaxID=1144522 RepID=A0A1J4J467_9EUKA|nr:putative long flagella protein lf4 [Tritrichomonas foetus]|eukprot:OHS94154.1 putative long flagella protein lf4 [Tritrichomonas foetus]
MTLVNSFLENRNYIQKVSKLVTSNIIPSQIEKKKFFKNFEKNSPNMSAQSFGPDLQVISKLGEGSFAEVFKVKSKETGKIFAIKRLKKRYRSVDEVNHLPEIYALKALQGHPNVIKLENLIYSNQSGYVAMVFEVMDCNVYELITAHKKSFDERTSLILTYQLLKAIAFMHSKNMFHRDIKPENCMVDKKTFTLKLCDFGSTRGVTNSSSPYTEYVSTRWYRAPECILTSGSYGPEVDEWAVGCMLYELMTTKPLFPGKHEIDQIARIHRLLGSPSREVLAQFRKNPNTQISFAFPAQRSADMRSLLPKASSETIDLLAHLLIYDPSHRISAEDALKMPCFAKIRQFEELWENSSKQIPFPLAFLNNSLPSAIHKNISNDLSSIPNTSNTTTHSSATHSISANNSSLANNSLANNSSLANNVSASGTGKTTMYVQPKPEYVAPIAKITTFGSEQPPYQPIVPVPTTNTSTNSTSNTSNNSNASYNSYTSTNSTNLNIVKNNNSNKSYNSENSYLENTYNPYSTHSSNISNSNNDDYQEKSQTEYAPVIAPKKYQPPQLSKATFGQPQPTIFAQAPPVAASKPQPYIKKPLGGISKGPLEHNLLAESRKRAAARIQAYNQKKLIQATVAKKQQPFHGAAFQFAAAKIQGGFQKPRPELVQPRLPKIIL